MQEINIKPIAKIKTPYTSKFGIPRQSGMDSGISYIVFEKEYAQAYAVKGLSEFSHLWLVWYFSQADRKGEWTACVRPPKLGGNKKMGVFATRSPFRPNPIGLSSVKLLEVDTTNGVVLKVQGADLMDGTPIFDIKPYLAFTDSHPDAKGGFTQEISSEKLKVEISENQKAKLSEQELQNLISALELDPRPGYKEESDRIYGFGFCKREVKFKVCDGILTVVEII